MTNSVSNGDLHRDLGRMEGKNDAMGERMDRLERTVVEAFEKIDVRLARIEAAESQRKGAMGILGIVCGTVGASIGLLVEWLIVKQL